MLKKRFFIILIVILQCSFVFSQSIERYVFTSAGSNRSGPSSIQSNFGELMINTYSNSSNILTQGFVQNDQLTINVYSAAPNVLEVKVFPNPVISNLTVEFNAIYCADIAIEVYNALGEKQIYESNYSFLNEKYLCDLNFDKIMSGIYFVRMSSVKNQFNKVFKITKR